MLHLLAWRFSRNTMLFSHNLYDHRRINNYFPSLFCPLFSTHPCFHPPGLRVEQELVTSYPQVVVVRVPTPWVQSDSDITVLRHLEKMGCRLINRSQAILNCVNKFWTFQELAGHGVPLPDTFSYGKFDIYFSY